MTVREKETVLDEKIVQRTEEVSDPITGEPTLQTFEYVEKIIEKEVRKQIFLQKKTICMCIFNWTIVGELHMYRAVIAEFQALFLVLCKFDSLFLIYWNAFSCYAPHKHFST